MISINNRDHSSDINTTIPNAGTVRTPRGATTVPSSSATMSPGDGAAVSITTCQRRPVGDTGTVNDSGAGFTFIATYTSRSGR